ncbi:MAG: acylphosphatase [Candidatus Yonathbacteria bacterium]|nr:acylphosphatase [Candidatus Yonathbacteria bacterium]
MVKRLKCIIHGRVHGVFYRDTTSRKASTLGLTGFVENQQDGTVLAVAEGEKVLLEEFLACLWKGSPLSKVARVDATWDEATGEWSGFTIRYRNFLDRF